MNYFILKDKIDNCFYRFFNLLSHLLFFFDFKARKITKKNVEFRNIYKGSNRCFILGTGPSLAKLKEEDILFLENETVFGVNFICKFDAMKRIVPKYYFLLDNLFWERGEKQVREILDRYDKTILFTSIKAKHMIDSSTIDPSRVRFLYNRLYPVNSVTIGMHKNGSIAMNVIGTAIHAALYMGFEEIYLLGCDFSSFTSIYQEHCYDNPKDNKVKRKSRLASLLKFYSITAQIHYLLHNKAEQMGCKIINLTENTLLDAYPLGKLESIIQEKKK